MSSGFLADKEWENMDWLTRAVEPYKWSLFQELAKLPTEHIITYDDIIHSLHSDQIKSTRSNEINMDSLIKRVLAHYKVEADIGLLRMVEQSLPGDVKLMTTYLSQDAIFDIQNKRIVGEVKLLINTEVFNDEVIPALIANLFTKMVYHVTDKRPARDLNELLDLLGTKEARKSTSAKKKVAVIRNCMYEILVHNKWKIKNVDLSFKLIRWFELYLRNGNLSALANINKIKCMTHSGNPIYSMEEVV